MTFEEYQEFAKQNWKPGCDDITFALGLGGETGEVLEILKKARRDQAPIDFKHLKEEIGDVLWYVANLCTSFGFSLEDVAYSNVGKLCERYATPASWQRHAEGEYAYRWNGPHIQKIDAKTGKHVKFCTRSELLPYVLEQLDKLKEAENANKEENDGKDDIPFD